MEKLALLSLWVFGDEKKIKILRLCWRIILHLAEKEA